jgi:hypothetical protein
MSRTRSTSAAASITVPIGTPETTDMPQPITITVGEPKDYFRDLVKRLDQYGITNRALAAEMGVDHTAISRWINSQDPNPTIKTIIQIETAIVALRKRMQARQK